MNVILLARILSRTWQSGAFILAVLHNWGASYGFQTGDYTGTVVFGPYQYVIGTTGYAESFIIPGLAIVLLSTCAIEVLLSPELVDGTQPPVCHGHR
jgi:hypothetical protein